jgi:glyoxylase-like metal-dependent hydrolase (beta-lactamase superfamily II)
MSREAYIPFLRALKPMEKVSDTVHFLEAEGYDSNTIIVLGNEPFLVDTGTGQNPEPLKTALKELAVEPTAIVNTHCHFDHCGGNHLFNARVYAHRPDDEHIRTGDKHMQAAFFEVAPGPQDVTPLGKEFRGWTVIHTPGHTQGSCCLLRDNILISGDTIFAQGYGRTDLPGGSEEAMRQSLALLSTVDYSILLPGHGPLLRR